MNQLAQSTWQQVSANALAVFGYVALCIQWVILLAVFVPTFFESSVGKQLFPKSDMPPPAPTATPISQPPEDFVIVLWMIFGVCMLALVAYLVFVRYVSNIAKTTSHSVKVTSNKIVPILTHKPVEQVPEKKRTKLTRAISFWLLALATSIPVGIAAIIRMHVDAFAGNLIVLCQSVLALAVLAFFIMKRVLLRVWNIDDDKLL